MEVKASFPGHSYGGNLVSSGCSLRLFSSSLHLKWLPCLRFSPLAAAVLARHALIGTHNLSLAACL